MGPSQVVRQEAGQFERPQPRQGDDRHVMASLAVTLALVALTVFLVIAGPAQAAGVW